MKLKPLLGLIDLLSSTSSHAAGFSYYNHCGKPAPMFVNHKSSVWAFFGGVCHTGDPFAKVIKESRGGVTKTPGRDEANSVPYSGQLAKP